MRKKQLAAIITLALGLGFSSGIAQADGLIVVDPIQAEQETQHETYFPIRQINFTGNDHVKSEDLQPALSIFLGEKKTVKDLLSAREVIKREYGQAGYMVVVEIPKEIGLDGVVNFKVVELTINKIVVDGNKFFTEKQIREALPELKEGFTPNLKKLSRQLFLANENPTRQILLNFKSSEQGDGVDVDVKVTDKKTDIGGITFDNTGTKESGMSRMGAFVYNSSVNDRGDIMAYSFTTSPEHASGVKQYGLYYQIPLADIGDKINFTASYSNVDSGTIANAFNISGQGSAFGLHYNHPTRQTLLEKESLDLGFDFHRFINTVDYGGTNLGVNVDSQPVSLGYSYQKNGQAQNYSFGLSYVHNIPGGSRNNADIYNQSRVGASPDFDYWRLNANYQHTNKSGWMVNIVTEGQYSDKPLISGEQFSLGGMTSIRGFGEREITGDKGVRLTTELYTPYISQNQRFVAFLDQGWYSRNNPQIGEIAHDYMSGAGIGWRWSVKDQFSARIDLAVALKGDGITHSGEKKIHFSLAHFFN